MSKPYQHSFLEVDGIRTHYIEAGAGDTFVLVHGGGAGSSAELNYGNVMEPLSRHFHTVAVDIVGYGYTEARGPEHYWGQAQGDFLVRFLESLDVGPVYLAGNSYGGFTVQYAAHERPNLIRKLVLINSLAGTVPVPATSEGRTYFYGPAGLQYEEPTLEEIRERLEEFYAHEDLVTNERIKLYYDTTMNNLEYAKSRSQVVGASFEAANKHRSYKGRNIADWAGELNMPVLLTWSEPGSKIEWALAYLEKNPGAEMHIFPWSGHHVQTDQRDRWVQVVINWLKNEPAVPPNEDSPRRSA